MKFGSLVVDTNRRQVSRAGERISLTYTEFSLLELLFDEPGKVVPRAEILEQLWGYPPRRAADLRVVDVYVARLRQVGTRPKKSRININCSRDWLCISESWRNSNIFGKLSLSLIL